MHPQVRRATIEDLPGILEIYNDAIEHTTAVYDYTPHTLAMRQKWFEEKQKANYPVLVAMQDEMVCGFAAYGPFRAWPAYQYSVEHSIYVHPAFRRKGIARTLMQELIELAKRERIHTIVAGIDASNAGSIALHENLGFVAVGKFHQIGHKFDRWLDLCFYQLMLEYEPDKKTTP